MTAHGMGWRPQRPDPNDRSYNLDAQILTAHQVPGKVDPLTKQIAAYDQGQLGACTGNGTARVLEYEQIKQGEPAETPSRLFIYYGEREIEGSIDQDAGAEIRDGIKVVAHLGAPPETLWPYSDAIPGPFTDKPSQAAYDSALAREAIQYRAVKVGAGAPFRTAIASGLPIVFGFNVPSSFEDGSWDPASEVLPLPGRGEQFIGGHCVVADGYDFTCIDFPEPFWWVANSWGDGWGDGGWFRMHANYFSGTASDFWTISRTK